MTPPTGVLFVCLGNICRSPLAKAVFTHHALRRGVLARFDVDSCGTGSWHAGSGADPRTVMVCRARGVPITHTARTLEPGTDFDRFHLLLAMDLANRDTMLGLGAPRDRVRLFRSFDPSLAGAAERDMQVPDPYYGGPGGFDQVFDMIDRASLGLLDHLVGR